METHWTNTLNSDTNVKSSSPLSAIKELANSKKLQPIFKIIKEEGSPHEKNFVASLNLGSTSWKGEGKSVKKAQIDAAMKALADSGVPVPTKVTKKTKIANPASLTPTVVLNGLAMARGENVEYKVISKTPLPCQPIYNFKPSANQQSLNWTKMYYGFDMSQSYNSFYLNEDPRPIEKPVKRWIYPQFYRIEVQVGDRTFVGEGKTQQTARHNAAQSALDVLQQMAVLKKEKKRFQKSKEDKLVQSGTEINDAENKIKPVLAKSPISLLYEKASLHNLEVHFDVVSETGPAHLKKFTMRVKVFKDASEILVNVEGNGHSKNVAKTNAAAAAIKLFGEIKLPQKPPAKAKNQRHWTKANVVNDSGTGVTEISSSNEPLHPCSRLTQYLQAKKEKMPVYTELSTDANKSKTSFVIQCAVSDKTATGDGKSKKEAKRVASENMLIKLGLCPSTKTVSQQSPHSLESSAISVTKTSNKNKKFKRKLRKTDVLPTLVEA